MFEHVGALLRIELFENVGDVCRMKFIKTGVGDGKLYVGEVAVEQVHVVPRDDLLIERLEVVYAHDLHALRVDDLAVEQIAGEQNLIGLKVAEADAGLIDLELDAFIGDVFDILAP